MTNKIKHKIAKVDDVVCKGCTQLWHKECVAYNLAHSDEEREHRKVLNGKPNCSKEN